MKNLGILALALVAALVLGLGTLGADKAQADVDTIQLIGCELIADGVDGAIDGTDDYGPCEDELTEAEILNLDATYGDDDGTLEPSDLEERDALDGNQIGEDCTDGTNPGAIQCVLLAFVYVDDEAEVTLDPEAGLQTGEAGTIDAICTTEDGATPDPDDDDCDDATPNNGDGVVVFHVFNDTGDPGDTLTVRAVQEGIEETADVEIVGTANEVSIALAESTIQTSDDSDAVDSCEDDLDVSDDDPVGEPNATVAIATVIDQDDVELARVSVDFSSSDEDIATIATGTPDETVGDTAQTVVPTDDTLPTASYAVVCGGEDSGDIEICADIDPNGISGDSDDDSDCADLTVVGGPDSIALTASPAQIACDGSQTSTVTATVTDADGNNVANGVEVRFDVVALGTANPIRVDTADGTASSTITPLSAAAAGVTVVVSAGDAESSIRVDCSLPVPTLQPSASPTVRPGGSIGGPDTGSGGYLGQDSSSGFPTWTLIALGLGSVALVAGGMVTRKVTK